MWVYNTIPNPDELYHYGVKGMKWGVRKKKLAYKQAKRAYNRAFLKADTLRTQAYSFSKAKRAANEKRWGDVYDKAQALNKAEAEYKSAKKKFKATEREQRTAERALAKMEKTKYKETIKKYAAEINAGESAVGRIYNKITGADKIQAEIRYDMEKRAKVNRKWST